MRYTSLSILVLLGHLFLLFSCKEEPVKVPVISYFTPVAGRADGIVSIKGNNFSERATQNIVKINGFQCTLLYSSIDSLSVRADVGVSTGKVSVTVGNLAAISFDAFVLKPQTITSISPSEGLIGDEITITGSNYSNAVEDVRLLFNDTILSAIYDYQSIGTADTIKTFKTKVPVGASTGKITVWIDSTQAESKDDFTVLP